MCDVKSNHCANVNCNFGTCVETLDTIGFECVCHSNHTGKFCDHNENPCLSMPCRENGTCIPNGDTFTCLCNNHRTGRLCECFIYHCESSPCGGGRCVNHLESYSCLCDVFHTGRNCKTVLSSLSSMTTSQVTTEGTATAVSSTPHVYIGSTTWSDIVNSTHLPVVSTSSCN